MKGIRVVLAISEASPELLAALHPLPARARAERVRMLATLGLAAVSGGLAAKSEAGHATGGGVQNAAPHNRATTFARSPGDKV